MANRAVVEVLLMVTMVVVYSLRRDTPILYGGVITNRLFVLW